jgi:hypothetical protein
MILSCYDFYNCKKKTKMDSRLRGSDCVGRFVIPAEAGIQII